MDQNIPHDRYGPLNEYNPNRINMFNPGGILSEYDSNGNRRTEEDLDANAATTDDEIGNRIQFIMQYIPTEDPQLRRSRRQQGLEPFLTSDCNGRDPISLKNIDSVSSIYLESDRKCYSAYSILKYYQMLDLEGKEFITPFRNKFTENDINKIKILIDVMQNGGKKRRITQKKTNRNIKRKTNRRTNRKTNRK